MGQEIRRSSVVMSCICCAMAGVSAGNPQMAWGLKSPGSFFTHMFAAQLGWLRLAGLLTRALTCELSVWLGLCGGWILRRSKQRVSVARKWMLQEKLPGFFWPLSEVTHHYFCHPDPRGGEMEPSSWWRCSQFTLKKSTLDGRCYRPSWSSEDTVFHTLASNNRATFLAHTKSSVDPGSSPKQMSSCWFSNPRCCFHLAASPYQLVVHNHCFRGRPHTDS